VHLIDETHDPAATSWVPGARAHPDFPVQNLPFGIFSPPAGGPRAGVAIGDHILDLAGLSAAEHGLHPFAALVQQPELNPLLARPPQERALLRLTLFHLLTDSAHAPSVTPHLYAAAPCRLHLPARIGDYTDFYAGIHHATNIGRLFRPQAPLLPNYKHIPIGYHGRASSVRPSGKDLVRPRGQQRPPGEDAPIFAPTRTLDFELELGVWIGPGNEPGQPITIADAARHIAGFCLLNDWSARDLQAWEYQPLGPFLAKSFHTTISPWIVTSEALAPFRLPQPQRPAGDPKPLDYLWNDADQQEGALGLTLEVSLLTEAMRAAGLQPHRISRTEARNLYWTVAQLVAHHSSNGCNLAPGDLLGTGTISGPSPDGLGSLMELTAGGTAPLHLPNGERRRYLEDGDEVLLSAQACAPGRVPIGFGACRARILPPLPASVKLM
jgi:fumarylacetoacetase